MFEALRKANRTLLEIFTGILTIGVLAEIVGLFIAKEKGLYSIGLWIGIGMAAAFTVHMYRSLDKALDYDQKRASTMVMSGYLIRYFMVAAVLILICYVKVINPLVVFFAFMSMKVSAFIQPFTHKFYNYLFKETDPIPQPMIEEEDNAIKEKKAGGDE